MEPHSGERKVFPRWILITGGILLLLLVVGGIFLSTYARPWIHERGMQMLQSRFQGAVTVQDFEIQLFPIPTLKGTGVIVRHHDRSDVPPLIQVSEFTANASLLGLFERPFHLHQVRLKGLKIQFPPKEQRQGPIMGKSGKDVPVLIDEIISDEAELDMIPGDPTKAVHQYLIHQLVMQHVGRGRPAPFVATLTNDAPPGQIHVKGEFGPWQPDDPRTTPLSATYTFDNADLSVFKGIAGILSSEGKFGGPLDNLDVEGKTTTPDFTVTSGGHPMMLKTEFKATVDGSNGNTLLHPVVAHLEDSTLVCNGGVVKAPGGKGRQVELDVVSEHGRIQDMLWLAVKTEKPPMIGHINLHTKLLLPSAADGGGEVVDRLQLDGKFAIGQIQFTDPEIRAKLENLSDRAQGKPDDQHRDDPSSQLTGLFKLKAGMITMRNLSFAIAGANVNMDGTYGLRSEDLNFHGKVRLEAKPSQMVTGVKSWLLKPVDPFLRKNGETQIPIKVTGKRSKPSFGLDFRHKKEDEIDERREAQQQENQIKQQKIKEKEAKKNQK